jgi:hypothetical protein
MGLHLFVESANCALREETAMSNLQRLSLILAILCFLTAQSPLSLAQAGGEATVPEGTRIILQLNEHLSTKQNCEGDTFTAVVSVPVLQGERLVIPKGSIVSGSISRILRPGRIKGKAIMNLLFSSIRIPGRGQFPIVASLAKVDAEGSAGVKSEGTVKGGGSVGGDVGRVMKPGLAGAGIGGLAGGARGSAIGAGVGALIGIGTVFATRGKDLEVRRGSTIEILLDRPLILPIEAGETTSAKGR